MDSGLYLQPEQADMQRIARRGWCLDSMDRHALFGWMLGLCSNCHLPATPTTMGCRTWPLARAAARCRRPAGSGECGQHQL